MIVGSAGTSLGGSVKRVWRVWYADDCQNCVVLCGFVPLGWRCAVLDQDVWFGDLCGLSIGSR